MPRGRSKVLTTADKKEIRDQIRAERAVLKELKAEATQASRTLRAAERAVAKQDKVVTKLREKIAA